ncbi:hypothetical protein LCGC14_2336620, partial [marine sediment metagenome]
MDKRWKQTTKLIPSGVQTLSKMPSKYVKGVYPIYIEGGSGCYVYDKDFKVYTDYPCALGAITLGYNFRPVTEAVKSQLGDGTLFSLPSYKETELAQTLVDIIPSAEQVRFLKTGSEATSAAIKIARSYTGKKTVLYCGYHGWHDCYTVRTQKNKGIPKEMAYLTQPFKYNDIDSLKRLFERFFDVACVIMEPYVFEKPEDGFLEEVRKLTHKNKALLIFDEVVTGFRTPHMSAQKWLQITPDLSTFGKGMANGFPMACVVGKKKYVK